MRCLRPLATAVALVALANPLLARERVPHDRALRARLAALGITAVDSGPRPTAAQVRLGQALFFDKILSGNRDIACATCHHPALGTGDALSLSTGTGGVGLGPGRVPGANRPLVPRNATEVFNRGGREWRTMFWDFRVAAADSEADGSFTTPAGEQLPDGLDGVLAAQALFPVTGRDEMRGLAGDPGNELATIADSDFTGIWAALMARLRAIPGYRRLFAAAYPHVPPRRLGITHVGNALAAFETAAFTRLDSPWDRYLAGNPHALGPAARRGALLFYGRAGCVRCHSGGLMTDQMQHNIAVPQLGPGKPPAAPLDLGCGNITGQAGDAFTFRTPPLRNTAVTGPWMHNGAYTTLEAAVRHHLDPAAALWHYDPSQLAPALRPSVQNDPGTIRQILATLDPLARQPIALSDREFWDLIDFLYSLTSTSLQTLPRVIPDAVPSGLPVDRFP